MEADLAEVAYELDLLTARYSDEEDSVSRGEEFVTAVIVELTSEGMTVANCGHPSPVCITPDGVPATLDASSPAPPLGLALGQNRPHLDVVRLGPGVRVLLYTDGLIEARDRTGRFFDLARAAPSLVGVPLSDAVEGLIGRVNAHAGGLVHDDVALVLVAPVA
jgi:serine phosphatase RsbU (regulator of sigma subunit)